MNNNFLQKIPAIKNNINWVDDKSGLVTLTKHNNGIANRIAQKLLKKPKVSFIHLEEFGSFIWQSLDGKRNILAVGELVHERFGEKAEPLYPRLSQYIKTLHTNGFIIMK